MTQYDARILRRYAAELYEKADRIVLITTLGYAVSGLLIPGALSYFLEQAVRGSYLFLGAVMGAVIGNFIGQRLSFAYRLQAQTVLCQVAIEENTRPATILDRDPETGERPRRPFEAVPRS